MPISTTEMELGAAVSHMDSTTQQLSKNMEVCLSNGQQYLAGMSVQTWNAWSQVSKMWYCLGIFFDKGKEGGHMVVLPLLRFLTGPVTCPAGRKFLLQIMECYLNSHPTVCTQQLLYSQAFRNLPSLFN